MKPAATLELGLPVQLQDLSGASSGNLGGTVTVTAFDDVTGTVTAVDHATGAVMAVDEFAEYEYIDNNNTEHSDSQDDTDVDVEQAANASPPTSPMPFY